MPTPYSTIFVLVLLLVFLPSAHAFGAGEIPEYAFLKGKSFRHGDIENVLSDMLKISAKAAGGGIVTSLLGSNAGAGKKFTTADIKRVYFGNWLRDYSQAMDIAGLSKLTKETIIMVLSVLSFMTFGYATGEYELTAERLGVYLPVEHIDNPKGYAEKEGDARKFHPWLRPPVRNEELEIDLRTGMKNYIANERGFWDTSSRSVRRNLGRAIFLARSCQLQDCATLHEAYRLLGTGLHTLEDLLAHSNWVELTLQKMGYADVFAYVGDNVRLNTPRGYAAPLVTGTFGSADFMFSVMSEGTDKISQNSLGDLNGHFGVSESEANAKIEAIKSFFSQLPSASSNKGKLQQADQMKRDAYHFDPNKYSSQQIQQKIWEALTWRDGIMRDVEAVLSAMPGLEMLVSELNQAATTYVYSIIQPYIMPYLKEVANVLTKQSKAVVDEDAAQFEVFDNPYASDPTHSMLSKDHFDNILNEPAGKVAEAVVRYTVELVVQAWSNPNVNIEATLDEIMKVFHHPFFADSRSPVHNAMEQVVVNWFRGLAVTEQVETLQRLTKDSVRFGRNKRLGTPVNVPLRHNHGQAAFVFAPGVLYQENFVNSGQVAMVGNHSSKQYSEALSHSGQPSAQSHNGSSYNYQGSQGHTQHAFHKSGHTLQHASHGHGHTSHHASHHQGHTSHHASREHGNTSHHSSHHHGHTLQHASREHGHTSHHASHHQEHTSHHTSREHGHTSHHASHQYDHTSHHASHKHDHTSHHTSHKHDHTSHHESHQYDHTSPHASQQYDHTSHHESHQYDHTSHHGGSSGYGAAALGGAAGIAGGIIITQTVMRDRGQSDGGQSDEEQPNEGHPGGWQSDEDSGEEGKEEEKEAEPEESEEEDEKKETDDEQEEAYKESDEEQQEEAEPEVEEEEEEKETDDEQEVEDAEEEQEEVDQEQEQEEEEEPEVEDEEEEKETDNEQEVDEAEEEQEEEQGELEEELEEQEDEVEDQDEDEDDQDDVDEDEDDQEEDAEEDAEEEYDDAGDDSD